MLYCHDLVVGVARNHPAVAHFSRCVATSLCISAANPKREVPRVPDRAGAL